MTSNELLTARQDLYLAREKELKQAKQELIEAQIKIENIISKYNLLLLEF